MTIKWHKISDGEFPKITGEEWDNRTNYEDIIAWCEIPKYNEQFETEKQAVH